MRSRQYQVILAAAIVAFGLWFLMVRLHPIDSNWLHNGKVTILDGTKSPESNQQPAPVAEKPDEKPIAVPAGEWDASWKNKEAWFKWLKSSPTLTDESTLPTTHISHEDVSKYVNSILDFEDNATFERLECPSKIPSRYNPMRAAAGSSDQVKYFFALDLYQSAAIIPRLMSSIIEAIRFLGPEHCAISVVEGRSEDGTYEILATLKSRVEAMGGRFFLSTSDINPLGGDYDRIEALATLRNMALHPLKARGPSNWNDKIEGIYSSDAIIIFINDIALCPEDILELVFQHVGQDAHMTCSFDWIYNGSLFYDVWVSRSLVGDTFFEIPHDASWAYSKDMFWNDPIGKQRYEAYQPFQVYSCWGGMVTLDAAPFAEDKVKFRASKPGECYMGEPTLLAKDMYRHGLGKVLAVPAVNVAYSDKEAVGTKLTRGYVGDHVDQSKSSLGQDELVSWKSAPPGMVKCLPNFDQPSWVDPV
ncbi:hypothetical protein N7532_008596 [Penicillium argentinense]|uniref:Alpha-1,3-mannosyltransferase CMT1 n=1 Tax=Penicillium argentinense TaxID=1131581 RepID=A0A9W9K2N5_9EURO|nr:uncharacterized protein N7532_008596 [Penicillium argentinense]KAJ5089912.1 hypothetical protein N7532_008596 [Penicillium argentinense]